MIDPSQVNSVQVLQKVLSDRLNQHPAVMARGMDHMPGSGLRDVPGASDCPHEPYCSTNDWAGTASCPVSGNTNHLLSESLRQAKDDDLQPAKFLHGLYKLWHEPNLREGSHVAGLLKTVSGLQTLNTLSWS